MNNNAKKWVEALRSDEFEQGKGRLQDITGFDALGVGTIIHEGSTGYRAQRVDGELVGKYLSLETMEWLGLQSTKGSFKGGNLADLNDLEGKTFKELADIIESEPEGLFVK